ncbi:MAG: DoxX family membrane protein [Candidatus Eremiobacteraeota bacterium]|nr:DoxX family membrane protein [Candidatus Eremiobacteraeota bacterium]
MKPQVKDVLRYLLAMGFIIAGLMHFTRTPFYVRIIPPPLASHGQLLVYLSGFCEILGGIGILFVWSRKTAGLGLLALLAAVFPANLYMALRPDLFRDVASPTALLIRLPMQFLFMVWVWFCCF